MKAVLASVSFAAVLAAAGPLMAQDAVQQPQPLPASPEIPFPKDVPYPGTIALNVDATDLDHRIFNVHETVPVTAGPMTLLFPKWLPGNHGPTGPIDKLGGLIIHAAGQRVEWTRDPVDVYAFHVNVPQGATQLDLDFQFLSPTEQREGRIVVTPDMENVEWNTVALYPAGYFSRDITFAASVRVPDGWRIATALETASVEGSTTHFKPTTFNTLVDSPLIAGRYYKQFDLDPGGPARVSLDVIADKPEELEATPEQIAIHRQLVQQAYKLYGSHHYDHYDFLFSLSDQMGGNGLEHHQSSEDGTTPTYFTEWDKNPASRDLLAHEYTHSWNGKFRRPADLWTPNFNVPMRDSLLWVYEGQTQYWGYVLAARSGLLTRQQALDAIAGVAATYDHRIGREWRAMQDTTEDPILSMRRPQSWTSWQRSEDYYSEGQLIWLDADTKIRELTKGQKSLDDFAKAFFGVHNGSFVTDPYRFEDVVATLNSVAPYDWTTFLRTRLDGHGPGAPLDGIARGGYHLVYSETETPYEKSANQRRKMEDFTYSLGLNVNHEGAISAVLWNSPAFKAGMEPGATIVAVNGIAYDADDMKDVVRASKTATGPIALLIKDGKHYRTVSIDYHGGLRYPHLERDPSVPARLDDILAPRK
ncbi:MAG TPA: peptidase M61 [Caulobacteraceae bacterium]